VVSGLALLEPGGEERTAVARTAVTVRELDGGLLDWYLARGEWDGRAGGYAIQGAGAALVRAVRGDYENVVGLPLASLLDLWPELIFACK
jgi:septum formation protein